MSEQPSEGKPPRVRVRHRKKKVVLPKRQCDDQELDSIRVIVKIPRRQHRLVKACAALHGMPLTEFCHRTVMAEVSRLFQLYHADVVKDYLKGVDQGATHSRLSTDGYYMHALGHDVYKVDPPEGASEGFQTVAIPESKSLLLVEEKRRQRELEERCCDRQDCPGRATKVILQDAEPHPDCQNGSEDAVPHPEGGEL